MIARHAPVDADLYESSPVQRAAARVRPRAGAPWRWSVLALLVLAIGAAIVQFLSWQKREDQRRADALYMDRCDQQGSIPGGIDTPKGVAGVDFEKIDA